MQQCLVAMSDPQQAEVLVLPKHADKLEACLLVASQST